MRHWLARFHVTPRADLIAEAERLGERHGLRVEAARIAGGYACKYLRWRSFLTVILLILLFAGQWHCTRSYLLMNFSWFFESVCCWFHLGTTFFTFFQVLPARSALVLVREWNLISNLDNMKTYLWIKIQIQLKKEVQRVIPNNFPKYFFFKV